MLMHLVHLISSLLRHVSNSRCMCSSWRQKKSSQTSSQGRDDEEPPLQYLPLGLIVRTCSSCFDRWHCQRQTPYPSSSWSSFADVLRFSVFQPHTREALPQWNVLLYVYGLLLVPVLFTLLVGINLLVWANARINYAFIFGV